MDPLAASLETLPVSPLGSKSGNPHWHVRSAVDQRVVRDFGMQLLLY